MRLIKKKILFVSHDANRAGAQLMLWDVLKELKFSGYKIYILLLDEFGPLLEEFRSEFEVFVLPKTHGKINKIRSLIGSDILQNFFTKKIKPLNIGLIYANTVATSPYASYIKEILNVKLISHIHELEYSISMYSTKKNTKDLLESSDKIIACSPSVRANLQKNHGIKALKIATIPSFVENDEMLRISSTSSIEKIKKEFKIPLDKFIVGCCGNAEWRKGVDLFLNLIKISQNHILKDKLHFVWVGISHKGEYSEKLHFDIKKLNIENQISLIEPTLKAKELINSFDCFFLSSREDPFPLVMLEAALCKKPLLGYEGTGGTSDFISPEIGFLSAFGNNYSVLESIEKLFSDSAMSKEMGENARLKILNNYSFELSVSKIKTLIDAI